MIDFKSNKKEVRMLYNIDINSPSFPAYKQMIVDGLETFSTILSIIKRKENQRLN